MSDEDLRAAERAALADPDDFEAFQRWRAASKRAGAPPPGAHDLVREMERLEMRWHLTAERGHDLCEAPRSDRAKRLKFRALDDHAECLRRFVRLFRVWLRVVGRRAEWDAYFFEPERFPRERMVLETSWLFAPSRDVMMLMQTYIPTARGRRRRRVERMAAIRPVGPDLRLNPTPAPLAVTSGST